MPYDVESAHDCRANSTERGFEPTLVANEIARAVALGEGLPETFFDYGCVPQESRREVYELTKRQGRAR